MDRNRKLVVVGLMALVATSAAILPTAWGSEAAFDPDAFLAKHTRELAFVDGKVAGDGADWLRQEAGAAQFFMLGEKHSTADIAQFATALYGDLTKLGYRQAAVEVGPWSTPVMERLLRAPGGNDFEAYLAKEGRSLAFPFFFFKEEAEFAEAVIAGSGMKQDALWGVDQEFVAGAGPLLDLLTQWADTPESKKAVAKAVDLAAANPMLLGTGDDDIWEELTEAFRTSATAEARQLLDDVMVSRRIYAPFTGRGGSVYLANQERERYMKTYFLRHLLREEKRTGKTPRVFLKFGANHVVYGHSPTHVVSLGTFVQELGWARGLETFNLHVDCAGGETRDPRSGATSPCTSYFAGKSADSAIGSFVTSRAADGKAILIDLRAMRPSRDLKKLDETTRRLILAYDAYLALPNPKPATVF